mmetsp:Transcript_2107/g.5361  ORF Transcript_2107/g.5361 Transcript_2107/m.5361 type:complete len:233 (+) Transcript_2107:810-1508(+)
MLHLLAAGFLKRPDHFKHRRAFACAKVDGLQAMIGRLQELGHRSHMPLSKVHDVDIITDTGPVRCGVVTPKHAQALPLSQRNLLDVRHEVVGDAYGVLTQLPTGMGRHRVEVAQQQDAPLLVRLSDVPEHLFLKELCPAVWADRRKWGVLSDGDLLWQAIHGAAAAEHHIFEPVLAHGTEKRDSALKVVLVILQGLGHAFPHSLVARKMDDCIKLLSLEHGRQLLVVIDVAL